MDDASGRVPGRFISTAETHLTLQGDFYQSDAGKRVNHINLQPAGVSPLDVLSSNNGENVIARWSRTLSPGAELSIQSYYDHIKQGDGFGFEDRDVVDFDLQHELVAADRHSLVWGLGYRHTELQNTPSFNLTWTPEDHTLRLFGAFIQEEIALIPDRLSLTLGSKAEHNSLTDWEIQPSVRLLWIPSRRQTLWAAVSRATRIPAVFERRGHLNLTAFPPPSSPPVLVSN